MDERAQRIEKNEALAFADLGDAALGDAQHSYHNIQWAGFEETYLRDNYVLG
ncbi:MAG: hypothetical protein HQ494_12995 [Rhodospirillales bacterium]|nr:hypothetical protein [Rhodospirillales bacterium]